MTTYRERRERRAEQRRAWAESRTAAAETTRATYQGILGMIPSGQPVLVGHHSEKRHRRDLARVDSALGATVAHDRMAERHEQAADEIERQLARSVYDDDPDAVERLTEKLERLEAKRDRMKAENAAFRKEHKAMLAGMTAYERSQAVPYASYSLTNLGATIRQTKQRIDRLAREREHGRRDRHRMMVAKYGGQCDRCSADVAKGDTMFYDRRADERMLCLSCGGGV